MQRGRKHESREEREREREVVRGREGSLGSREDDTRVVRRGKQLFLLFKDAISHILQLPGGLVPIRGSLHEGNFLLDFYWMGKLGNRALLGKLVGCLLGFRPSRKHEHKYYSYG